MPVGPGKCMHHNRVSAHVLHLSRNPISAHTQLSFPPHLCPVLRMVAAAIPTTGMYATILSPDLSEKKMTTSLLGSPYDAVCRHDTLQMAPVRWFGRSHWSCRYSDSLGCQLIIWREKEGSTGPTARRLDSSFVDIRVSLLYAMLFSSVDCTGHPHSPRRPIHPPTTIKPFVPYTFLGCVFDKVS